MKTNYKADLIAKTVSGQWAVQAPGDVGEVNGWGPLGVFDNSNTQDWGNYNGRAGLNNRQMGGYEFPFPVRFRSFSGTHRNNTANDLFWAWLIYTQVKTDNSATRVSTLIYDGAVNNYSDNNYHDTVIAMGDLTDHVIPAGTTLCLAVGTQDQTTANQVVQMYDGEIIFERLS